MFDHMDIPSADVFNVAATKWNFHHYRPGLVGGHCIPVDPYYLAHAASQYGYDSKLILSGRSVNNSVPEYIATRAVSLLREQGIDPETASVIVFGATFKKDVVDTRNSKAIVLIEQLSSRSGSVDVYDPLIEQIDIGGDSASVSLVDDPLLAGAKYDLIVFAVAHSDFADVVSRFGELLTDEGVVMDVTGTVISEPGVPLPRNFWSL